MTNQGGVQQAVRDSTGTALDYNGDWSALFDADGIAAGAWSGRMLAWINNSLGTSYVNVNEAMQAFAVDQGFNNWSSMNTILLSDAATLATGESNVLALAFTDMSAVVRDTGTPANNFSGSPATLLTYASPSAKIIRVAGGLLASGSTLRTEYDTDGTTPLGVLFEEARTELCLHNSDFTNGVWTPSNITPVKTATGPDGVANSASTLTATAGNGTILQSITSASNARITSCWIKRRTGSGTINLTMNNGTTWTAVTVTSSWTMVQVPSATSTNPIVGIRIVTSGDAVDVAYFSNQVGTYVTSPIATGAITVNRELDIPTLANTAYPFNAATATIYYEGTTTNRTGVVASAVSDGNVAIAEGSGEQRAYNRASAGYLQSLASITDGVFFKAAVGLASGANASIGCINGTLSAVFTNPENAGTTFHLGDANAGSGLVVTRKHVKRILVIPRRMTNAELQALTTP